MVSNGKSNETMKVPIIFAAGEKWAMLKKGRALRDRTGALILPLITIRRVGIEQNPITDVTGRGINQQTGELVIKRRLSTLDRNYQNLINKLGLNNQLNLSDQTNTLTTTRPTGENEFDPDVRQGALLAPKNGNNIWEVITIPSPQFFSATYEVTFWAQYTIHMNQMLEKLLVSFLPQGQAIQLDTPKGYWFIATVDGGNYTPEDNADDMSSEERILKYKFTIKVPAYIVAPSTPGIPQPVRRFVSAPSIGFEFANNENEELVNGFPTKTNPYDGADDPTRGFSLDGSIQPREQRTVQQPENKIRIVKNPFTGKEQTEYIRVVSRNVRSGEATLKPADGVVSKIVDS